MRGPLAEAGCDCAGAVGCPQLARTAADAIMTRAQSINPPRAILHGTARTVLTDSLRASGFQNAPKGQVSDGYLSVSATSPRLAAGSATITLTVGHSGGIAGANQGACKRDALDLVDARPPG